MISAKKKFEDDFYKKFIQYMKFLAVEKEKERMTLNNKLDEKNSHDAAIKQLENKISKQKDKLELLNEYKIFLIFIKERKLYFLKNRNKAIVHVNPNPNATNDSFPSNITNGHTKEQLYLTASIQKNITLLRSKSIVGRKMHRGKNSHDD